MKRVNTFSITKTAEELVPDFVSRTSYLIAFAITIVNLIIISILWKKIPNVVPLFFTEPWGEARLAGREWLYLIPAISFLVILVNVVIGKIGSSSSPLLPRMLGVTSAVVAATLLLSCLGIVQSLSL